MSFEDETNQLRWTIADCIGSWSSCFPSILLGSSGGLDSSIVAVAATPRSERLTALRSEEHTSELQSLMRISYAVFCLKKKKTQPTLSYHSIKQVSHRSIIINTLIQNTT